MTRPGDSPVPGSIPQDDLDTSDDLVVVKGLVVRFGGTGPRVLGRRPPAVQAVRGVSFTIARGETLGLVGESGSGKSTTGRALVQLHRPSSGSVLLDGEELTKLHGRRLRDRRKRMQMIFQDPYGSLDPQMRIRDIVAEPLYVHGLFRGAAALEHVDELLETVGLSPTVADRYSGELSGGQRQRVGIARALAVEPDFIVADEPTSALDVSVQAQIVRLMRRLQGERGLTYLFISHNLAVVRTLSDRIAVMYAGRIVEVLRAADLNEHAMHPYTRELIAAVAVLDPRVERERINLARAANGSVAPPDRSLLPVDISHGCSFRSRCPYATQLCSEEDPPLRPITPDHAVACHYAEEVAASAGPLNIREPA